MSSLKQESCQNCCNSFTEHNPPRRLINCYHYMCQRCLISQKICRKCGADIGLNDHFLKDYLIVNLAEIDKEIRSTPQKQISITDQIDEQELLEQFQDQQQMSNSHRDEFFVEQCLLHSKPADLICLTDKAIICSTCALFGKHKGHQVSNREGVLTKFTTFVEDCLKIYDEIKQQNTKFSSQTYRSEYWRLILQKKQSDQKRVSDKFQALISMIRVVEKKQQLKLNEFYKQKQKYFEAKQPKIQKLESQIKKWMLQIQNIGTLMSDTSSLQKIAEFLPYIDEKSKAGSEVLLKGETLMQKYLEVEEELTKDLKKQKETDFVKFDEEKIKQIYQYVIIKGEAVPIIKRPESIPKPPTPSSKSPICLKQSTMKFKSSSKKQHLRTQTDAFAQNVNTKLRPEVVVNGFLQDNLLLSVDHSTNPLQRIKDRTNIYLERVQVAEELDVENIPHLSISDIRPVTNMSSGQSSDQSRFLIKDRQLKQFVNDGLAGLTVQINKEDVKKKKKVDFPEKYKGIVDDLKNDRAQTIDLTGAEVGDGTILSLCPFIRKSKKLKTLKLIKNKLTDDCLAELFEALAESRACSLNLSQNLLTDKSCLIISNGPISTYLKTITLTLNKLNRRNVKVKIDELAKKNVTVLL